jgi:hypothetical protein
MFWTKTWVWIKHHWYVPAMLIYTIILWAVFRKSSANVLKVLNITKESYQKELAVLRATHENELKQKEEIVLVYQETLKKLEKEHNIKVDELSKKKQKEIHKLVGEHKDNPSALADEMKRLFEV